MTTFGFTNTRWPIQCPAGCSHMIQLDGEFTTEELADEIERQGAPRPRVVDSSTLEMQHHIARTAGYTIVVDGASE